MRFLPPRSGATSQQLSLAIHLLADGGGNNTGTFTLDVSPATTTTVTDVRMSEDAYVLFVPLHADAATVAPSMYLSTRSNGSFVVTHAANASTDLDFAYVILGV